MRFPLSTGRAARILGVTEPQLSETIRRGRVSPPPAIFAGRRLWHLPHLLQAADALGVAREVIGRAVDEEEARRGDAR